MINKQNCWMIAPVVAVLLLAGCDLSGLDKAADDFDLIIELEEITTTVAAQVVDLETFEAIPNVQLDFSGPDAGVLIDVYSDPIEEIEASAGVVTFGIDNTVQPTEGSPVEFDITAVAEGYLAESVHVAVADTGGNNVTITLMPDKVVTTVEGTSGVENNQTEATAESGVQQAVAVATPQQNNVQATTTARIEQGTKPLAADGTPLSGRLRTQLQVFDLEEGLDAVPPRLKSDEESALLGLAAFGMTDEAGRLAFDFESGGTGKTQHCAMELTNEVQNEDLYAAIEAGLLSEADISVSALDVDEDIDVGSAPFVLGERPTVIATICVGGTDANVDMDPVRQAASAHGKSSASNWHSRRRFYWRWRAPVVTSVIRTVTLNNSGNQAPQTVNHIAVKSLGRYHTWARGFTIPPGESRTLRFNGGMTYNSMGSIVVLLASGDRVTDTFTIPPGNFDRTVQLPAALAQEYTVHASLACPSGQKLSPQITEKSFSGLSLGYRPLGRKVAFADAGKARNISVTEGSVSASAMATLIPGVPYEFRAVYGNSQEVRQATPSAGSTTVNFNVNPSEISGISCE